MIKRSLVSPIQELCLQDQKMAFISGPRQVGKTTLARQIAAQFNQSRYITWDNPQMRRQWNDNPLFFTEEFNKNQKSLLIIDEIHKSKLWKTQLKGLWDQKFDNLSLIVTGSAQLGTLRKAGDSLLGRYYNFNLHPLTVGEIFHSAESPENVMQRLLKNDYPEKKNNFRSTFLNLKKFSGFPEPFSTSDLRKLNLWRKSRLERLIREDLRDLSKLPDLSSVEVLASLLPEKVGSSLSVENLRSDLESSHNTIKRWLKYLEATYYHYSIRPYSTKLSNSIRREPKIYLYDYTEITNEGALYENMIANHLFKTCQYWTDLGYGLYNLQYVRTKQQVEIDFLITLNKKPWLAIETKKSNQTLSKATLNLLNKLSCPMVLLLENEIKPTVTQNEKQILCKVSIDRFLPLIS